MSSLAASRGTSVPERGGSAAEGGIVFIIPPGRPPSGGDLYNRFLIRALQAEVPGFASTTLAGLATGAFAPGTEFWVDSLYIPDLDEADLFQPGDLIFFVIHSLPSEDPGRPPGLAAKLRQIEDRLFRRASGFLVTGTSARDALRARGQGYLPILCVPPAPCVVPRGTPKAPALFTGLIVSSLIQGKGVPAYLEALGRQVESRDDFLLRLAGRTDIEPRTAAACLEAVGAHPLLRSRVVHLGFIPYEDLGAEYETSSALISPSSSETFGMAFHEARAFGLPILALRAPYSEPFIGEGRTGLLFETAADLARGTLELVRHPERLRVLAAAALENRPAADYTWADAARSFLRQRRGHALGRART
jgi:glycosyltransferase involved in cell wall biosynthesis